MRLCLQVAEFTAITADRPREAETPGTDPRTDHCTVTTLAPSSVVCPLARPAQEAGAPGGRGLARASRENSSDRVGLDQRQQQIGPKGLGKCPGPLHTGRGSQSPQRAPASTAGDLRQRQRAWDRIQGGRSLSGCLARVAVADEGSAFAPSAHLCPHLPTRPGWAGRHLQEPQAAVFSDHRAGQTLFHQRLVRELLRGRRLTARRRLRGKARESQGVRRRTRKSLASSRRPRGPWGSL